MNYVSFSEDGRAGSAVGWRGGILHYKNGQWIPDAQLGKPFTGYFSSIWVAPNHAVWGTEGTYLGRLQNQHPNRWRIVQTRPQVEPSARFPRMYVQGAVGPNSVWLIRYDGAVLLFQDEQFETRTEGTPQLELRAAWLALDGSNGWGLDSEGELVHFNGRQWLPRSTLERSSSVRLLAMKLTRDGRYGVAVGERGGLLEYRNGVWGGDKSTAALTRATLRDVWLSHDGEQGWAVGDHGTMLTRTAGNWRLNSPTRALSGTDLGAVWGTPNGSRVWVADRAGSFLLVLKDGRWSSIKDPLQLTAAPLVQVGCGEAGSWTSSARGDLYYYQAGKWIKKPGPGASDYPISSVWLDLESNLGWAVGKGGKIFRFANGAWNLDSSANSLANKRLISLAFSQNGQIGWAVGTDGTILRYEDGTWKLDRSFSRVTREPIYRIWLASDGKAGWAISPEGLIYFANGRREKINDIDFVTDIAVAGVDADLIGWLAGFQNELYRLQKGKWERQPQASSVDMPQYMDIWLSQDGSSGWMVGRDSALFLQNGRWVEDRQPGYLTNEILRSVCMAPDLRSGWAVGDSGTILRYEPKRIAATKLRPLSSSSLESLRGRWSLRFNLDVEGVPQLGLIDEGRGIVQELSTKEYDIRSTHSPREFIFELKPAAATLGERLRGVKHRLQVQARMRHPSLPVTAVFRTDPFYVEGRPTWQKGLIGVLLILGFNLLAVVAAVRIVWIRTVVLHPVGSLIIGLGISKFLLIHWLVRFVTPVKRAIFRDYRLRLPETAAVAAWQRGQKYILPEVTLAGVTSPVLPNTSGEREEDHWQYIFRQLLGSPRRRLWLVVGPSGLGKTALLENWTQLALKLGETPLLIRLRGSTTAMEEASSLMAQHGDIDVSPEVAFDLLKGGGFLLFLDGFNEDRNPEATREFVRRVTQRNLVVMTSQFDPGWRRTLEVQSIKLEVFGKSQLVQLLGEARTEEVLTKPALAEMAHLPFTALLLARFLKRHEILPTSEVEVYSDLREGLDPAGLLNLEESAWKLFKANEAELISDGKLSSEFCESAVESGVLTRRTREGKDAYRFVHERIHRMFVASWLDRQDRRPLIDWYSEIQAGLGRAYWADVLDFWGKVKARRSIETPTQLTNYLGFLSEGADFSREIFAHRLYPHYDRLCTAGVLPSDPEFVTLAARILASAVASDAS